MTLQERLGDEWYQVLEDELRKPYMGLLSRFIAQRRQETTVYPSADEVFTAFRLTPLSKVRVCIIGQDPYIREGQAHGLSFSTKNGAYTPSLIRIEHAIRGWSPTEGWSNNLTRWALQGVLLLNSVLTVDQGKSNSHAGKGWETFTTRVVQELDKSGKVMFLLWGKYASEYRHLLHNSNYFEAEHPVAASYQGRDWKHGDCFNKVNELLTNKIDW